MAYSKVMVRESDMKKIRDLFPGKGGSDAVHQMISNFELSRPQNVNFIKRLMLLVGVDMVSKAFASGELDVDRLSEITASIMPDGEVLVKTGEKGMRIPCSAFQDDGSLPPDIMKRLQEEIENYI